MYYLSKLITSLLYSTKRQLYATSNSNNMYNRRRNNSTRFGTIAHTFGDNRPQRENTSIFGTNPRTIPRIIPYGDDFEPTPEEVTVLLTACQPSVIKMGEELFGQTIPLGQKENDAGGSGDNENGRWVPMEAQVDMEEGKGEILEQFIAVSSDPDFEMESSSENAAARSTSPGGRPPPNQAMNIHHEHGLPRPADAPRLTIKMMIINEIVISSKPPDTLIIEYQRFKIHQQHLQCFVPGRQQWLQDDVMDYYLALVAARNKADVNKYAKTFMFHCTFYTLLASANGLSKVKDAAEGGNIFEYEYALFPVCQSHHWRLVVANMKEKTVTAYNSLQRSPDLLIVKNIVRYLQKEYNRIHPNLQTTSPEWTTHVEEEGLPQQDNSDDCGVFTLAYADLLTQRKAFQFEAQHMTYFRARMLYECISGRMVSNPQ